MITQQLLDYIAQEIQGGVTPDAIQATLRSNGWIETDIEQALRVSTPTPQSVVPPVQIVQPAKTEFFIPSQKKSPIIKILLVVVGLLLVAGVTYAGFVFTSSPSLEVTTPTATTTNPIPEPLPVASSTPEIPLTVATTTATSTPSLASATSTASTTPAVVQDCGSISSTIIINPQTTQDKASLACMSKAFVSCSLATFTVTGTGYGSYKINGKSGSYCSITQKITTPPSLSTCKIPMNLISDTALAAKEKNQIDLVFLTVPFLMNGSGPVTNTKTGEKITIECSKS